jgi:hypothetical protein
VNEGKLKFPVRRGIGRRSGHRLSPSRVAIESNKFVHAWDDCRFLMSWGKIERVFWPMLSPLDIEESKAKSCN